MLSSFELNFRRFDIQCSVLLQELRARSKDHSAVDHASDTPDPAASKHHSPATVSGDEAETKREGKSSPSGTHEDGVEPTDETEKKDQPDEKNSAKTTESKVSDSASSESASNAPAEAAEASPDGVDSAQPSDDSDKASTDAEPNNIVAPPEFLQVNLCFALVVAVNYVCVRNLLLSDCRLSTQRS